METTTMRTRLNAAIALFMALVLAIGLAPLPQAQALTAANLESQATGDAVTVALTIVDEHADPDVVLYNGKVSGLTTENTVADLLSIAGFSKVDSYAGDFRSYIDSNGWGYPGFLGEGTDELGSGVYLYWADFFNSSYDMSGATALSAKLKPDGHYQYIYTSTGAFEYTTAIPDPLTTEVPKSQQLLNNLAARFGKGGVDSSITKHTYGAAIALGYLGKGDRIDDDLLGRNLDLSDTVGADSAGSMAKYAMAFAAAGKLSRSGLISNMEAMETGSENLFATVLILAAYNAAEKKPSSTAKLNESKLVSGIIGEQADSGLFPKSYSSVQATAQAMFALAPYKGSTEYDNASPTLVKARAAAVAGINADGTVTPDRTWNQAKMDYDAMGELIDALIAYDGKAGAETAKLVNALVAGADSSLDGFSSDDNISNESMSASAAFRGLAAAWKADPNRLYLDNAVEVTDIAKATVATIGNKTYTGSAIAPAPVVSYNGKALRSGTDYTVAYSSNTAVGTASVTLTGKGLFKGTKTVQFKIVPAGVSAASAAAIAGATYSGSAVNPVPTLTFGGKALKSGTDFTVSYLNSSKAAVAASNVKAAGTYYARVAGKGNFTGTKDVQFSIAKAAISKTKVKKISKKKYTGKAIKPKPVVKFNGKKLKKGVDYKLSYSKNKKVGTAKVKIKGKGNFKGTKTVKFKIVKK